MRREAEPFAVVHSALFVCGLRIEACVGVHVHERGGMQPLIVDLEVEIPLPGSDELSATLDYVDASTLVRNLAVSRHFDLVETFAQSVCREFFALDAVERVSVRVVKPSALAGSAEATGFELEVRRA